MACMEMKNSYNILGETPQWKRPFGRYKCKWKDNIKIDPKEIRWEVVDWMYLVQDRLQ
jgi:hypothetical protein